MKGTTDTVKVRHSVCAGFGVGRFIVNGSPGHCFPGVAPWRVVEFAPPARVPDRSIVECSVLFEAATAEVQLSGNFRARRAPESPFFPSSFRKITSEANKCTYSTLFNRAGKYVPRKSHSDVVAKHRQKC